MSTRPILARCSPCPPDRRKRFFATQKDACLPSVDACGNECAKPGHVLVDGNECLHPVRPYGGKTIENDGWVEGLLLNILGTSKRRDDTACGWQCGNRGGHWSDSFRTDGLLSGTALYRNQDPKCLPAQAAQQARAALSAEARKLVLHGVASKVEVEATYVGRGRTNAVIKIYGSSGAISSVGMTGSRVVNGWAWETNPQ